MRALPRWPVCLARCLILLAATAAALPGQAGEKAPATVEAPTALTDYVQAEYPAFRWEHRGTQTVEQGTVYDLFLVSQEWQGIVWEHQLQIYQPADSKPAGTMLLWNQGGTANDRNTGFGLDLARRVGAPIAFLYGIPRQPLFDGKKEDTLIAETFVRYLETKDAKWPLLFPMVKSLVRAMDALEQFSERQWQQTPGGFVVSGASKRGWTTWLTAAADRRVKAIAPLVIDTLNMKQQMPYQLKSFGAYSEQINDYTARGLVPMPDTPDAHRLWTIVDPWAYRARLTVPKMIINGANDPYWTTDALNLYWDDLPGAKWVTYVPNAGHNLEQHLPDGRKDRERALNSLAAFTRHMIKNNPMPRIAWKHGDAAGKVQIVVESKPAPVAARVWLAQAPTRDFRIIPWKEVPVAAPGARIEYAVAAPAEGHLALFAELDFEIDGLPHQLSTQMRIIDARPAE